MTDEGELLTALAVRIDAACNAALDGGLSVDQVGYVLACAIGTCSVIVNKDNDVAPEKIAEKGAESVRRVLLDYLTRGGKL